MWVILQKKVTLKSDIYAVVQVCQQSSAKVKLAGRHLGLPPLCPSIIQEVLAAVCSTMT